MSLITGKRYSPEPTGPITRSKVFTIVPTQYHREGSSAPHTVQEEPQALEDEGHTCLDGDACGLTFLSIGLNLLPRGGTLILMRNYFIVALCLSTVLIVAVYVFLLRPQTAKAQDNSAAMLKILRVTPGQESRIGGRVVGFSCTSQECFVAVQ